MGGVLLCLWGRNDEADSTSWFQLLCGVESLSSFLNSTSVFFVLGLQLGSI